MNQLSKEAEGRLLSAVRDVCSELDSSDCSPTAAVVKVARDARLEPGLVPLLVQAYNTGQVTLQRQAGESTLEKFAEIPLADTREALRELYPKHVDTPRETLAKTAVSAEYDTVPRPSLWEQRAAFRERRERLIGKCAAAVTAPALLSETHSRNLHTLLGRTKRAFEDLRRQQSAARDALTGNVLALRDYFKTAHHTRLLLGEVEADCQAAWGNEVTALFDGVSQGLPRAGKRASALPLKLQAVDLGSEPYAWVKAALDARTEWTQLASQIQTLEKQAGEQVAIHVERAGLIDDGSSVLGPLPEGEGFLAKRAAGGFLASLGLGSLASRGLQAGASSVARPTTPQLVDNMVAKLEDPSHENNLRSIRAKADLTDFLANDDVISGFDPDEVLDAYNEISQLSPRATGQPALMRSLLRKRLTQGAVEPFEAGQIVDIEKGLRENTAQRPQSGTQLGLKLSGVLSDTVSVLDDTFA